MTVDIRLNLKNSESEDYNNEDDDNWGYIIYVGDVQSSNDDEVPST